MASRRALMPSFMKSVQQSNGHWRDPVISPLKAARQRRAARLSNGDFAPLYVKPLRDLTHITFKGHAFERNREDYLLRIKDKMAAMPQKLKDYHTQRQMKRLHDTDLARVMNIKMPASKKAPQFGGGQKKAKKIKVEIEKVYKV